MKVKEYLAKYGVKLAAIVLAVALVVGLGSLLRDGVAGALADGTGALAQPVRQAATAVVDWLEGVYGYLYEYDRLTEENAALKAELTELREQVRNYDELETENQRLRILCRLQEKREDFVFESAKIVSWDSSNYASAFTISKGESSGVALGNSVVTESGALVGQIIELGENWARVRTIVDVNMDVGALVGENSYAGMIVGEFSLMQAGCTRMTYLAAGSQIFEGDEVLTSGKGGAFPAGLLIGTVTTIMSEAGGQTTYGVVEPACDLENLSQVFVIKDYEIVE